VTTFDVSSGSPTKVAADLLIVPFFEGSKPGPGFEAVAEALGADLRRILKDNQVTGRSGDSFPIPTMGRISARNLLLLGVGSQREAGPAAVRTAIQRVAGRVARFPTVATTLPQIADGTAESAQAFAEGLLLGSYRFDRYKERPIDEGSKKKPKLRKAIVLGDRATRDVTKAALARGQVYAEATNWARDLVNTPALDATPDYLAQEAKKMATMSGLGCKIWTKAMLEKGGFGGVLGVGSGSVNEPRLIELTYKGGGSDRPIALTGKGITFDSGGLSIKPADGMETMKDDMGGAAATLAAMRGVAQLKTNVNVIAAIPSAENMPGGSAIRPGDVLHHYGGKTSEVLNTDAEGRLVLADALAYLAEKNPALIIDTATLTGAAMIALGTDVWAVIGSDRGLIRDLLAAGEAVGEPGWELPLWMEYRRKIESSVADVKNIGDRYGGAITAALFLKEFVGDVPWAHLDVAGTAFVYGQERDWPRGATGSPARTIIRFIEDYAADGSR
jgi:leucyl aminopeptidase